MEFYPTSFEIDEDTRKVHFSVQGKKMSMQDVHVNLRGVHTNPTGICTQVAVPVITLARNGDGFDVVWEEPIDAPISVVIEAQGAGGQTKRGELFLRPAGSESATEEAPTVEKTPIEKYHALIAVGFTSQNAVEGIETALGKDVADQVRAQLVKETL